MQNLKMKKQRLHYNNCTWTCWKAASVCGLSTLARKIYPPRKSKHKHSDGMAQAGNTFHFLRRRSKWSSSNVANFYGSYFILRWGTLGTLCNPGEDCCRSQFICANTRASPQQYSSSNTEQPLILPSVWKKWVLFVQMARSPLKSIKKFIQIGWEKWTWSWQSP